MSHNTKIDMRYGNVRDAIVEVASAYRAAALNDDALAVLIANASKKVSKSQVLEVLKQLPRLEKMYLKAGRA